MDPTKREVRKLKRDIKRAGSKHRRRDLKRDLRENPEEAAFSEENFGRNESSTLNGLDSDATRKRKGADAETAPEPPAQRRSLTAWYCPARVSPCYVESVRARSHSHNEMVFSSGAYPVADPLD